MAERSFPLNNTDYGAEDAQLYFATRTRGVFAGDHLAVTANGDMTVTLGTGIAWLKNGEFGGLVYGNTAPLQLTVPIADAVYPRIDRVVIRHDVQTNSVYAYIKQGTAATNAVPPALQRDALADEISVAQVHVPAAAVSLSAVRIFDERLNSDACGLVSDGTRIDTSVIEAQWKAKLAELDELLSRQVEVQLLEQTAANTAAIAECVEILPTKIAELIPMSKIINVTNTWVASSAQMVTVTAANPQCIPTIHPYGDESAFATARPYVGTFDASGRIPVYIANQTGKAFSFKLIAWKPVRSVTG